MPNNVSRNIMSDKWKITIISNNHFTPSKSDMSDTTPIEEIHPNIGNLEINVDVSTPHHQSDPTIETFKCTIPNLAYHSDLPYLIF